MGDDGFDPCECIWSHELAMRRLLSLLRQSQGYCTDTECLTDGSLGPQPSGSDNSLMLMMMCWMLVALVLYMIRPSSMRDRGDTKHSDSGQGSPPAPPALH